MQQEWIRRNGCVFGLVMTLAAALFLTGCPKDEVAMIVPAPTPSKKDYSRPLPPGANALRKLSPETNPADQDLMPNLKVACANPAGLQLAIERSLNYLSKPSSKSRYPMAGITHAESVASLEAMLELLIAEPALTPDQLHAKILSTFDVYISVGCDDQGTVLYTGYYTPIFDASRERSGRFQYPLYKQPAALQKDDTGKILGLKQADGSLSPCPSRAEIESGQGAHPFAGEELFYLGDPFEAYIAHVQGSAILKMPDGKLVTAGYAATNGHDYKSVGKAMIDDGLKIDSLQSMIAHFKAHPEDYKKYTHKNPRYVFFREATGAPRGCLNEPVSAWRSIATDKSIFPAAALAIIETSLPRKYAGRLEQRSYTGFALDQDSGGAIRAPGRCDVYLGIGEDAGELAGRTQQEGKLFYLFRKAE